MFSFLGTSHSFDRRGRVPLTKRSCLLDLQVCGGNGAQGWSVGVFKAAGTSYKAATQKRQVHLKQQGHLIHHLADDVTSSLLPAFMGSQYPAPLVQNIFSDCLRSLKQHSTRGYELIALEAMELALARVAQELAYR